jgi:hypothetical protein
MTKPRRVMPAIDARHQTPNLVESAPPGARLRHLGAEFM